MDYLEQMAYASNDDHAHTVAERILDIGMELHDIGWDDAASYFANESHKAYRKLSSSLQHDERDNWSPEAIYDRFLESKGVPTIRCWVCGNMVVNADYDHSAGQCEKCETINPMPINMRHDFNYPNF